MYVLMRSISAISFNGSYVIWLCFELQKLTVNTIAEINADIYLLIREWLETIGKATHHGIGEDRRVPLQPTFDDPAACSS